VSVKPTVPLATDWLIGGGEMAKLIKAKDWSKTPLGPIESWPDSLRTVVSLAQASSSPISIAWGPHHIQIYNDGYWPICGDKHPTSMGQDFRKCWEAPWAVIGEAYESARAGKTAYLENMRMFLDRYGFLEETWFTFSFSPITDRSGSIAGLFHPVTELTAQSLSERRTQTLRDLAGAAGKSATVDEAFQSCASQFTDANLDVPFALFYLLDETGFTARLMATAGLPAGTSASPAAIDLNDHGCAVWPIAEVIDGHSGVQIDDLTARLGGISVGPYPELPRCAFALPLLLPGQESPAGVVVLGVSARLHITEPFRAFLDLVAAAVSAALANARAHEAERQRAEALAEIDRAKTAFFSNVSHEFRTPLTLMLGPLEDELAEIESPLPAPRRERIETAHRNSLRLLKLVNALLDFSRIEAGRMQARYEPTDLAALTRDLASSFRSAVERGGLALNVECPPLPEPIYVDREMWEKIVLNLLSNAFKHTFQGGISVSLAWCLDRVELTVADTGAGIPAIDLPQLFNRFYRVKGAVSRTHEGTGIGLSLIRELLQLHDGSIRVESDYGLGSRFVVVLKSGRSHLPAEKIIEADVTATALSTAAHVQEALHWLPDPPNADAVAGVDFVHPAAVATDAANAAERPRILWADDNADMRHYVSRLLGGAYEVTTAADGEEALAKALDSPPDLVLSDVMMPRLDGFGLLSGLREHKRTRRIPVVLLSARSGEEAAHEGLAAGADDYLIKPFTAKELLARVRAALSQAQRRREWEEKLSETNRQLAEAAESKSRFLATMSHEIRTPLNAVIGMAGLLADTPLNDEQRDFADTIRSSGDHLLSVINDILDYSKLESGKLTVEKIRYSVANVVEETLDMVSARAREKELELAYELSGGVPPVVIGDPGRVRQILLNYLSNAVKFTERGEVVLTVSVTESDDKRRLLCFAVRDTGIGLSAQQRDLIFEPFIQADDTIHRKYGGTGLGLSISRKLAELMGGGAWVEGDKGQGSTFCFSAEFEVPADIIRVERPLNQATPLAGIHAWIIDDNDTNRRILRHQAESWGMLVRDSSSAQEAVQWAGRDDTCDLLILDFKMPVMNGLQLAAEIHRLRGDSVRQLLLSSSDVVIPSDQLRKFGIVAQLTKPVRHSILYSSILNALDRKILARGTVRPALPTDLAERVPLRILVAEDNATNIKLITIILNRLGYRADVAANGLEAIDALRRQSYDVVLMDVQMPEMDGIEATRRICAEWPQGQRPRIIALTAGVLLEQRQACLDAGMDEFLNKPVVSADLIKALERCGPSAADTAAGGGTT
jgi:signal transduction histidine kinase